MQISSCMWSMRERKIWTAHIAAVDTVLQSLTLDQIPRVLVFNKCDQLPVRASGGPVSALRRNRHFGSASGNFAPTDPPPRRTAGRARPSWTVLPRNRQLRHAPLHLALNPLHNRPILVPAMTTKSLPSSDHRKRLREIAKTLQRTMPSPTDGTRPSFPLGIARGHHPLCPMYRPASQPSHSITLSAVSATGRAGCSSSS